MADLGSTSGRHPRAGVLAGAAGSRFVLDEPVVWSAEDDPFADMSGGADQVMSSWEDLSAGLEDELAELLAHVPADALDSRPVAPEVEVVEQGRLELDDAPLLHARDRAVEAVVACDAREARLFAERVDHLVQVHRLTVAAGTCGYGAPVKSLGMELGGSRRLGAVRCEADVAVALRLTEVLPVTLAGLRAGTLNVAQAQAVRECTHTCSPQVASEVERRLFADPRAGLRDPSRLRSQLRRLVLLVEAELEPQAQADREGAAVDGREVSSFPLADGMAGVFARLTAEQSLSHAAAFDVLCRMVKADDLARGISRTAAQRRADVFAQLPGWVLRLLRERSSTSDRAQHDTGPDGGLPDSTGHDHHGDTHGDGGCGDTAVGISGHGDLADDASGGCDTADGVDRPPGRGEAPPPERPPGAPPAPLGWAPPPVLLPGSVGPVSVTMNVHVPLATALGQSHAPAYLERYGWISAAHARRLLPQASLRPVHVDAHGQPVQTESPDRTLNRAWRKVRPAGSQRAVRQVLLDWARRTRTDPPQVISTPEPQYEPSAALLRHLQAREVRCTGPGCAQPAHRCEMDHLRPYADGGPTAAWNLGAKSTRCHNAKTHGGWSTLRHEDGSTTWTSPLRRRYWTPAFWTAPPAEDPDAPLPDPDDPALTHTHARPAWPDDQPDDDAPGLQRELDRYAAREQADAERQAARAAEHAADAARRRAGSPWARPQQDEPDWNGSTPPF